MNAACCLQPASHGEFKAVDTLYLLCVTSAGSCLESVFFPRVLGGIRQGAQCAAHNCRECHVRFLSYLYVYTCFAHKYFIEVGDNSWVCVQCMCLFVLHERKTGLTRVEAERRHLPGEGCISSTDVKVSKSIQVRLITVALKWAVSPNRHRDTHLSSGRHCTEVTPCWFCRTVIQMNPTMLIKERLAEIEEKKSETIWESVVVCWLSALQRIPDQTVFFFCCVFIAALKVAACVWTAELSNGLSVCSTNNVLKTSFVLQRLSQRICGWAVLWNCA